MEKMQWFKFSISEWKMGKIQKCTPEAKSSFMELCCLYWINETKLSIEDAIIECDEDNYKNLLSKKVIKEVGGFIKIYFLVFICIGFAHLGRDPLIRKLNETLLSTRPDPQLFKNVFM